MAGHVAVHAANAANREVLKIIGFYLLAISAVGSLAQPTSPFWAGLVSALILIGTGYGWICKSQSRNAKPCLAIASTGPQRLGALVPDAAQRSV